MKRRGHPSTAPPDPAPAYAAAYAEGVTEETAAESGGSDEKVVGATADKRRRLARDPILADRAIML